MLRYHLFGIQKSFLELIMFYNKLYNIVTLQHREHFKENMGKANTRDSVNTGNKQLNTARKR